jgi:hypothetical protein
MATPRDPRRALRELESLRLSFGRAAAARKRALLKHLAKASLPTNADVLALHELLCFMRAWPDSASLLSQVNALLAGFATRRDLRRHRDALADSGVAGTDIHYRFYWPTARRLARRWPAQFDIDWDAVDEPEKLAAVLPQLVTPAEAAWLRNREPALRPALKRLAGPRTTAGTFLVRQIGALAGNDITREAFHDALDTPMILRPGSDTPSRTLARHARSPVAFVRQPLVRTPQDLRAELLRAPPSIRHVRPDEGAELIELATGALVTRSRDIDGIAYADARDVWMVDDGDALQWTFFGLVPERRQLLRASHGFVTLRSGVPIGYGQFDTLFRTADVSFNSFETFRGPTTAKIFVRLLAATHALFGASAFTLDGYQIGHHNEEAIASGAWWFYYKLGFRPRNAAIRRIAATELARMRSHPGHLSTPATLRRLAADTLYFETGGVRAPVWPRLFDVGTRVAEHLARGGTDRTSAVAASIERAKAKLGVGNLSAARGQSADIQRAWADWAPLVELMPMRGWSTAERRAAAAVIAAKGGRSEIDFLRALDAHPKLAASLRALLKV